MRIRIALCPYKERIWIEGLIFVHAGARIVRELAQLQREAALGLTAGQLAHSLDKTEHAIRQDVYRFRCRVFDHFVEKLGRSIEPQSVIENARDWNGYRLNLEVVDVVPCDVFGCACDISASNKQRAAESNQ